MIDKVKVVRLNKDLPLPKYETKGAAGMDLMASVEEKVIIKPGERKLIKTGIAIELPKLKDELFSLEAQVRPRSGLALKKGITVCNSPGCVDQDFRGEIGVILINHSDEDFEVNNGDRIAQLIYNIVVKMKWQEVEAAYEKLEECNKYHPMCLYGVFEKIKSECINQIHDSYLERKTK
jgi:dUTP pyrophosphatase